MSDSLYNKTTNRLTKITVKGFDYKGQIFSRSISPYILNDPKRANILTSMEKIIYFLIEKTKSIKTFVNYTVDRDYKHLN